MADEQREAGDSFMAHLTFGRSTSEYRSGVVFAWRLKALWAPVRSVELTQVPSGLQAGPEVNDPGFLLLEPPVSPVLLQVAADPAAALLGRILDLTRVAGRHSIAEAGLATENTKIQRSGKTLKGLANKWCEGSI
jgi:hypothetical protein